MVRTPSNVSTAYHLLPTAADSSQPPPYLSGLLSLDPSRYSELHWSGQTSIGLAGKRSTGKQGSVGVELYDFAIRGEIRQRCDSCPAQGLGGAIGGGSVIQGLIIQHTKVGM